MRGWGWRAPRPICARSVTDLVWHTSRQRELFQILGRARHRFFWSRCCVVGGRRGLTGSQPRTPLAADIFPRCHKVRNARSSARSQPPGRHFFPLNPPVARAAFCAVHHHGAQVRAAPPQRVALFVFSWARAFWGEPHTRLPLRARAQRTATAAGGVAACASDGGRRGTGQPRPPGFNVEFYAFHRDLRRHEQWPEERQEEAAAEICKWLGARVGRVFRDQVGKPNGTKAYDNPKKTMYFCTVIGVVLGECAKARVDP